MAAGLRVPSSGTSRCSANSSKGWCSKAPTWATAARGSTPGGGLTTYNAINQSLYKQLGSRPHQCGRRAALLTSRSLRPRRSMPVSRSLMPNFPDSGTVIQSLRPFPQYGSIGTLWAPLGDSWYNALQAKLIKRYSRGLTFTGQLRVLEDAGQLRRQRKCLQSPGFQGPLNQRPSADPQRQRELHHAGLWVREEE